jgi:hypothetical protein
MKCAVTGMDGSELWALVMLKHCLTDVMDVVRSASAADRNFLGLLLIQTFNSSLENV